MNTLRNIFAPLALAAATILPSAMRGQETYASAEKSPVATALSENRRDVTNARAYHGSAPMIIVGDRGVAQDISLYADGIWAPDKPHTPKYVGVYMVVDKDYPRTPEFIASRLQSMFDEYGLPVKFVKQANPFDGKTCTLRIYVAGKAYDGDVFNGNVSPVEITENKDKVFTAVRNMYIQANSAPGLSLHNE